MPLAARITTDRTAANKKPVKRFASHNPRITPISAPPTNSILNRKPACSCGGTCPKCQAEAAIQPKLKIGTPNDKYEQEADRVAEQVMRMPDQIVQRQPEEGEEEELLQPKAGIGQAPQLKKNTASEIQELRGDGQALDTLTRKFMEPRFGRDFSQVRIHIGNRAANLARTINARAFTVGRDVVMGENDYSSMSGRKLLAHELTHVIQQNSSDATSIQRTIELRPPGRGEASAFDRAQELVDRLNGLSLALSYTLGADGRTLIYRILLPDRITNFDQQMMDFIDLEQVIPMRLITSAGTVNGFPIVGDSFQRGYVDLDDLMASDDLAFQSIMLHFLEERAVTRRYEQRIGTPGLDPSTLAGNQTFTRAHRAGHNAQAEHFRDVLNDPSIIFNRERGTNAGDADIIFRSRTHNYRILVTLRRAVTSAAGSPPRNLTGGTVSVRYQGQNYTVDEFLTTGPLAATLRPLNNLFGIRPHFGFDLPGLNLDPALRIRFGAPGRFGPMPSPGVNTVPTPNLTPEANAIPNGPRPNALGNLSFPTLSPDPNLIDWLPIRGELNSRGLPFDDGMQSSIVLQWINNYSFLNQVIGLSPDQAAFWTNRTISMAVGAGVSRDFPSMIEQMDRELNTSSLNIPASDILIFLISR